MRVLRLGGVLGLVLAGPAVAQDAVSDLKAAEKLAAGKHYVESLAKLDDAVEALAAAMPLSVRDARLVEEAHAYGGYTPRASNLFKPDDTVRLYVEPLGYRFRRNGELYEAELAGDVALKTAGGQILLAQKDFAHFPISGRRRNREFYLTISYTHSQLKPGDYTIVTTLRDLVGGKSTSFETPIRIEAGKPAEDRQGE